MRRSHTPPAIRYIYKIHLEPRTISFYFTFIVLRKIRIEIEIAVFFRLLLHTAFFFSSCWCMAWIRSVRALADDLCFIFLSLLVFFLFRFVLLFYAIIGAPVLFIANQQIIEKHCCIENKNETRHNAVLVRVFFSRQWRWRDAINAPHKCRALQTQCYYSNGRCVCDCGCLSVPILSCTLPAHGKCLESLKFCCDPSRLSSEMPPVTYSNANN